MKTVMVIGGGITGLSTMYYLQKSLREQQLDARLVLIEANETLGGKIKTVQDGEFIMETGADSIITRKPNVAPLLEELNLQEDVVYNATGKSFIHVDGELKLIPEDTIFGIPMSLESLAKTDLISAEGKVEALKDFYTKNETFTKNDSIGFFLESFLGKELVEKQIAPVISGVYSGKLKDLTIASTLPYLLDYKNEYGSIIKGLSENMKKFKGSGDRKFLSFKHGVSALIDGLEKQLTDVEILKGTKAERIQKDQGRYRITLNDSQSIEADFVVLAAMHTVAQSLLQDEELDVDFNQLKNSSLISVYLGFDVPDSQLPEDGTGFIVAENSDLVCNACTWTSRKWQHTSENNHLLVRLFYKSSSPAYETLQKLSEEDLMQVALKDIKDSLGLTAEPVKYEVTKWHETMPNYHIKHHEIVQSLEKKIEVSYPHILLAGCSYYGVGIPDCIANGEKTAETIVKQMDLSKAPAPVF
ncbi:protoporphyrinogen oxidase [Ammoniphilus sp. 3BR4]|uniref:protoporphyrinogen oxidase n=1 Tax=Ammoniphilus sp. 3BR4 TaxID=3158265 RepID=UPI0034677B31